MRYLLDANVLIALVSSEHEFHDQATKWLARGTLFATCPITEGALIRFLLRMGDQADSALTRLEIIHGLPHGEFWSDDLPYTAMSSERLIGYRQVTDFYLAALAQHNGGLLATFDEALCLNRPDQTLLVGKPGA